MGNLIQEIISGESLVIDGIVQDDGSDTPFPIDCTCSAVVYNSSKGQVGDIISGDRGDETEPFVVTFNKTVTSEWDGKLTAIVTVEYPDGLIAAKDQLHIKAEKF